MDQIKLNKLILYVDWRFHIHDFDIFYFIANVVIHKKCRSRE